MPERNCSDLQVPLKMTGTSAGTGISAGIPAEFASRGSRYPGSTVFFVGSDSISWCMVVLIGGKGRSFVWKKREGRGHKAGFLAVKMAIIGHLGGLL